MKKLHYIYKKNFTLEVLTLLIMSFTGAWDNNQHKQNIKNRWGVWFGKDYLV